MDEFDLDKVMASRFVPAAPSGMAARIANAALEVEQEVPGKRRAKGRAVKGGGFIAELGGLFEDIFYVPRPAYALAVLVVFGFVLGVYGADVSAVAALTTQDLSSYMVIDDRFVATEFLSEVE